jgi:ankyrin repeat protein
MPPPQLPLEILFNIACLLTNDKGELCFADFNSFLKINRAVYVGLNHILWQQAAVSKDMTECVFMHLIRNNDLAGLKFFLELGADVETLLLEGGSPDDTSELWDSEGTPLKVAVDLDNIPMARLLLEHGADVIQYDADDHPAHSAIHVARSAEMVELLLDYGADPEHQVANRLRPLHYYVLRENIEAMRAVLRYGVEVDPAWVDQDVEGFLYPTPLHYAARCNIDAVKLLLDHGADVRKKGYFEATSFHSAATAGKTDVMRLLHESWPEGIRDGDSDGCTPFHYAADAGQTDIMRLLLQFQPDGIKDTDDNGNTPLHSAASDGRTEVVELLVEAWPEGVREKNKFGYTPLHSAAAAGNHRGQTDVVKLLVERWPEGMKEKNQNGLLCTPGDTPLHSAAAAGNTEVVRLLVEGWPEGMKAKNKHGNTPLHVAAGMRKTEVVRLLVDHWPEGLREKDKYGNTPLHSAAAAGNTEVVRLLVESWPEGNETFNEDGQTPLLLALEKELWFTLPDHETKEILALLGGVY